MLVKFSAYSIFYIIILWILESCYGFVLLSSAARQNGDIQLFSPGEELVYNLHSTMLLNEKSGISKNVGFFISAQVVIHVVWAQKNEKILKLQLRNPKLHIRSRKAPSPDGFVYHTSRLEEFKNEPYYISWNNGKINNILVNKDEPVSMVNVKKGIASLFQFQLLDGTVQETDASGDCSVEYTSTDQSKITKSKLNCLSPDLPYLRNPDFTLDANVKSARNVHYAFDPSYQYFKVIRSVEDHTMALSLNGDFGNQITSDQVLMFVEYNQNKVEVFKETTAEDILHKLISIENLSKESLKMEKEVAEKENFKSFPSKLNELRDQLNPELFGSAAPAKAFVELVSAARKASKEDITRVLNGKKNVKVLPQILDILGSVPTIASYESVMSKFDFTKEDQLDHCERYLWALSLNALPNADIMDRLLIKYKTSTNIPPKLNETLLLSLASMSYRQNLASNVDDNKFSERLEKLILEKLRASKPEESYAYLRALKNLKSPTTIPDLLKKIKMGTTKEGALAWKALKAFHKKYWTDDVLKAARKAFLQLDRKHDTSSRTIASEILLESDISDHMLKEVIYFLSSNDTVYEVKKYGLQKILMLAENNPDFHNKIFEIIKGDKYLNNYSVLNPRGMSTAIRRSFMQNQAGHGSLISLQEINNAVVKRGVVNIMWDKEDTTSELFSLGIFTSGLTSFISSEEETNEEPEPTIAGLELTVLGTQLRPFVFFNGQGELMGHVWSGTASERTTAYQALIMLQDHLQYIPLGSGFIVEIDMKGAVSFDLAGKVEISIWGRTAESLVEKCAGIFATGSMKIDNKFVRSQVEFTTALEPQLKLESDIDFSSNMRFCMRLSQVDVLLRHNIYKIERIPGSKHKLRIAKYRKITTPGVTYALNRKNNEMCNAINQ